MNDHSTPKKSPSLEIISNFTVERRERRYLPRLSIGSEQFKLDRVGKLFSVADLSLRGMGLWFLEQNDHQYFSIGRRVSGTLNLKREKFPVNLKVRNLVSDRVGCEFEEVLPSLSEALSRLLDPATLGSELKPIPAAELNTLWYQGPSGTDLLLRRGSDGQFRRLILYILGTFTQWDNLEGLTTGLSVASDEHSETRGIIRLESLYLDTDPSPDPAKLNIAKTAILSSNLPQDLKSWCIRQLER